MVPSLKSSVGLWSCLLSDDVLLGTMRQLLWHDHGFNYRPQTLCGRQKSQAVAMVDKMHRMMAQLRVTA